MTNVAICSIFYNSSSLGGLATYQRQINALDWPRDSVRLYLAEGDSTDDTWAQLKAWNLCDPRVYCGKKDLQEPYMGSLDNPRRLWNCSVMGTYAREMALRTDWAEYLLWVESDLLWEPDLLKRLMAHGKDVIAPWCLFNPMAQGETNVAALRELPGPRFYDSWGFRYLPDGLPWFGPIPPRPDKPFGVHDVGSCVLWRRAAIIAANHANDRANLGDCEAARMAGYEIWADPTTEVWHIWPKGGRA